MILFYRIFFFFSFRDIIDSCYCLGIFFFFFIGKIERRVFRVNIGKRYRLRNEVSFEVVNCVLVFCYLLFSVFFCWVSFC